MEPKAAYIDYTTTGNLMLMQLRMSGIKITSSDTLDSFLKKADLNDFPVLLYHPGVDNISDLKKVIENYPNLKVAQVTTPFSTGDYKRESIPIFGYDSVQEIKNYIIDNQ